MLVGFTIALILKSVISAIFLGFAFSCILAIAVMVSWLVKSISENTLVAAIVVGSLGTAVMAVIGPISETLVLEAMGFTIAGLLAGEAYEKFAAKSSPND